MKIGLFTGATGPAARVGDIVEDARRAEGEGFAFFAMANIFSHDAMGALTLAAHETERIELMTAVVPTYPRHPHSMAQQAVTVQAASGGSRFVLGIGLSHQVVIEGMFGMSFEKPARHMAEYLDVLLPLLRGEAVRGYEGEQYRGNVHLEVADAPPVSCMLAAMGPAMLRLAGSRTDGTILWMTGAQAIESHIAPKINAAAESGVSRIVCGLPVLLTGDADAGRQAAYEQFQNYGRLPSYRGMLDLEGAEQPGDAALIGGEEELGVELRRLAEAGATDFGAVTFGSREERERTRAFLASLAPEL